MTILHTSTMDAEISATFSGTVPWNSRTAVSCSMFSGYRARAVQMVLVASQAASAALVAWAATMATTLSAISVCFLARTLRMSPRLITNRPTLTDAGMRSPMAAADARWCLMRSRRDARSTPLRAWAASQPASQPAVSRHDTRARHAVRTQEPDRQAATSKAGYEPGRQSRTSHGQPSATAPAVSRSQQPRTPTATHADSRWPSVTRMQSRRRPPTPCPVDKRAP